MPVYEVRNPTPVPPEPESKPRTAEQVDDLRPVAKVRYFRRQWIRRRWEYGKSVEGALVPTAEKSVRRLIDKVNQDLERQNVKIHLRLLKEEENYLLDIYDCSDNKVCNIIGDLIIPLDDLPHFIKNLQEEAGVLLDTTT